MILVVLIFTIVIDSSCWPHGRSLLVRTSFAEFVSPALVDVVKPDVVAPGRLVAFSSPHHTRRIRGPQVPRTEYTFERARSISGKTATPICTRLRHVTRNFCHC